MSERALESDVAVRKADLRGVLMFYLLRHGALTDSPAPSPQREVYQQARDSAEREILWRFEQAGGGTLSHTEG